MSKLKNVTSSVKKFASDHKVALAVAGTAAITAAAVLGLANGTVQAHVDFLKEKNLLDEFNTWETTTA